MRLNCCGTQTTASQCSDCPLTAPLMGSIVFGHGPGFIGWPPGGAHRAGCPYMTAAGGMGQCTCTPEAQEQIRLRAAERRYEYVRTLNVMQFKALFEKCLAGPRFDDEVDAAIAERTALK